MASATPSYAFTTKATAPQSLVLRASNGASGGSLIYRASKAAAVNLGRNLAVELKGQGISVGIYHPGWVQTDMGGASAAITPAQSAAGLIERIHALGPATTGCFETWDGTPFPF